MLFSKSNINKRYVTLQTYNTGDTSITCIKHNERGWCELHAKQPNHLHLKLLVLKRFLLFVLLENPFKPSVKLKTKHRKQGNYTFMKGILHAHWESTVFLKQ